MEGKVIQQINNLKITQDNKARCYRVYTPNGEELYRSNNLQDIQYRCKACKNYIKRGKKVTVLVKWSIDVDDILNALDEMTAGEAAKALGVPFNQYKGMTEAERDNYVEDCFYGRSYDVPNNAVAPHDIDKSAILGLPKSVTINLAQLDMSKEDAIIDYLSNEYGFCIEECKRIA